MNEQRLRYFRKLSELKENSKDFPEIEKLDLIPTKDYGESQLSNQERLLQKSREEIRNANRYSEEYDYLNRVGDDIIDITSSSDEEDSDGEDIEERSNNNPTDDQSSALSTPQPGSTDHMENVDEPSESYFFENDYMLDYEPVDEDPALIESSRDDSGDALIDSETKDPQLVEDTPEGLPSDSVEEAQNVEVDDTSPKNRRTTAVNKKLPSRRNQKSSSWLLEQEKSHLLQLNYFSIEHPHEEHGLFDSIGSDGRETAPLQECSTIENEIHTEDTTIQTQPIQQKEEEPLISNKPTEEMDQEEEEEEEEYFDPAHDDYLMDLETEEVENAVNPADSPKKLEESIESLSIPESSSIHETGIEATSSVPIYLEMPTNPENDVKSPVRLDSLEKLDEIKAPTSTNTLKNLMVEPEDSMEYGDYFEPSNLDYMDDIETEADVPDSSLKNEKVPSSNPGTSILQIVAELESHLKSDSVSESVSNPAPAVIPDTLASKSTDSITATTKNVLTPQKISHQQDKEEYQKHMKRIKQMKDVELNLLLGEPDSDEEEVAPPAKPMSTPTNGKALEKTATANTETVKETQNGSTLDKITAKKTEKEKDGEQKKPVLPSSDPLMQKTADENNSKESKKVLVQAPHVNNDVSFNSSYSELGTRHLLKTREPIVAYNPAVFQELNAVNADKELQASIHISKFAANYDLIMKMQILKSDLRLFHYFPPSFFHRYIRGLIIAKKQVSSETNRSIYLIESTSLAFVQFTSNISSIPSSSSSSSSSSTIQGNTKTERRFSVRKLYDPTNTNDSLDISTSDIDDAPLTLQEYLLLMKNLPIKYRAIFSDFYIASKVNDMKYLRDYNKSLSKPSTSS